MHITLVEAASLLGVTKETLRNWDRSGKLKSIRNPHNNYRIYLLSDVQELIGGSEINAAHKTHNIVSRSKSSHVDKEDSEKDLKNALAKIHKILRDTDGNSSIIERFDEVTKLIFLKLISEKNKKFKHIFSPLLNESVAQKANRIRTIFSDATKDNKELFPERFRRVLLSDKALTLSIEILEKLNLSNSRYDIKGFVYEEMIRNTFDKGDNQQFFTPPAIVEFLVKMTGDSLGGVICDPASGTGGFLVEIAKQNFPHKKLIGLEIDERLAWVAGINLFVHGAKNSQTICLADGGSLGGHGKRFHQSFDSIITNPPFGSDFTDRGRLDTYQLGIGRPSRRRGVLFIEQCLKMLKEEGVLGIIIDEGVLSLSSNHDVRNLILSKSEILAVISLPETAFMPYASVSTSILILKKVKKPSGKTHTFYARAERIGRKPNGDPDVEYGDDGTQKLISDLPAIITAWERFKRNGRVEGQPENIYLSKLSHSSALPTSDNRLDFMFHHPSRHSAKIGLKLSQFDIVPIRDICSVRNESFVPSIDFIDQAIPYTGLAHIEPKIGHMRQVMTPGNSLKSSVKKYYAGDILFAKMRPNLKKVAFVDGQKPGYASAECVILTVNKDKKGAPLVDPFLLSILLRSDYAYGQIIHLTAGIGRPRVSVKDILDILIPLPPPSHQKMMRKLFLTEKKSYDSTRIEAKKMADIAAAMELKAIENIAKHFVGK